MNIERFFVASAISGVIGIVATGVSQFPEMFKNRFEFDMLMQEAIKAVNAAINLELPPSFKTVWLNNLTGIPTAVAIVSGTSLLILGIDKYIKHDQKDTFKKTAILAGAILTFYCTGSLGLSLLNSSSIISMPGPALVVFAPIMALFGRTLYSVWENSSNQRNYEIELAKHYTEYLDYNNGAARKAAEICNKALLPFFGTMVKNFCAGFAAAGVGTTLGSFAGKKIAIAKPEQNKVASAVGAVTTGVLSFCLTGFIGLSLANAGISAVAPFCFPK